MRKDTIKEAGVAADPLLYDDWFDAIEDTARQSAQVRRTITPHLPHGLIAGAR